MTCESIPRAPTIGAMTGHQSQYWLSQGVSGGSHDDEIQYSLPEGEYRAAVTHHRGQKPRTEVTSRVDGVTGLEAQGRTDAKDGDEQRERNQARWRRSIVPVCESTHH